MSGLTIQWLATLAVVGLASCYLLRHFLLLSRPEKGSACGSGCASCSREELLKKRLASLDEN